jgi:hypothetical protein
MRTVPLQSSSTGGLALTVDRIVADAGPFDKVFICVEKHENRPSAVSVGSLEELKELRNRARSIR